MNFPKQLTILLAFVLVAVAASWFFARKLEQQQNEFIRPVKVVRESQARAEARAPTPLRSVTPNAISSPPPPATTPPPAAPSPEPSIREVCSSDWMNVANRSELDLRDDLRRGRRFLSVACLLRMRREVKSSGIQNFIDNCQLELEKKDLDDIDRVCVPLLPAFRAYIIRQMRAGAKDLAQFDTGDLANQLMGGFIDLRTAPESEVQRNIEIADALIERNPDFYPAYKAKLLNLLIEELKFRRDENLDTYQGLYDNLLRFRGQSQQEQILGEAQFLRGQSPPAAELNGIDSDLVHIPFLRLSALGDVDGLDAMARDYIAAYPSSYVGYFYLAEVAWKAGDRAAAVNILKTPLGRDSSDAAALELLTRAESEPALDRLMRMSPD